MDAPETRATARDKRKMLALVVERSPVVQRLERCFLEEAGHDVEFASDGAIALARARELRPDILVTGILVPKIDGLALCRLLKSQPDTKDIIILVLSHLDAEDRALEAGADAFLGKPLDEGLLVEALGRLVARQPQLLREKK